MNRKLNQKGFSPLIVVVGLVVLLTLGGVGYYIWQRDDSKTQSSTSSEPTTSHTDKSNTVQSEPTVKFFSLLDGKVTFTDDTTWKKAEGGYFSEENNRCGQGVTSDLICLDHQMLILSSEKFTNPDQFQVNIAVYERNGLSIEEWGIEKGGESSSETIKVSGLTGQVTTADYGALTPAEKDLRVTYIFPWDDKMIVVTSHLFYGDNYSFKSNKDYTTYQPKLRELVESLEVK